MHETAEATLPARCEAAGTARLDSRGAGPSEATRFVERQLITSDAMTPMQMQGERRQRCTG